MPSLFITSTGLSVKRTLDSVAEEIKNNGYTSAAIIVTAATEKERSPFVQSDKGQLARVGLTKIVYADLETDPDFDFSTFDIIYVSGGNTFKLMKYAQLADLKSSVVALLARDGCYIGVSAGSIILSPTIEMAETGLDHDPNEVGLTDLTGLGLVPFHMCVHYTEDDEPEIRAFEQLNGCTVMRISDSQAVVIGGEKLKGR